METNPINDWKLKNARNTINIIIVGKVGHGKSATGNSIIGSEVFETKLDCSRVTHTSYQDRVIRKDGLIVDVIDTPGFDSFTSFELINEDIIDGIHLAKDGIHALLMVFSLRSCFSKEEEAAFESMKSLFGDKFVDHMILVFTHGDILESKQKSLKDFISLSPEPLKNIIQLCKNRVIVFDNTTKDKIKREEQVNELLSLVELVNVDNGGKPYSNKDFAEMIMIKERAVQLEVEKQAAQLVAESLGRISLKDEMIQKLKEDINEKKKKLEEKKKELEELKKRNTKCKMCFFL